MMRILAVIALLLPAISAADEPKRAGMVEAKTKAVEPKIDKAVARMQAAIALVENDEWLAEIAHDAATTGRQKIPKLPDGVVVTVIAHESSDKNPFGRIPTPKVRGTGAEMTLVHYKIAEGKRGAKRAIMWVDRQKIDYKRLRP